MKTLEEEDDEAFKRQFSQYIKNGITADSVSTCHFTYYSYLYHTIRPVYNYCRFS